MSFLLHPPYHISSCLSIRIKASTILIAALSTRDQATNCGVDRTPLQVWSQYIVHEGLFGLSFNQEVEFHSDYGRPPSTFFSHSSESE